MTGIDDPSKALAIAAYLEDCGLDAVAVRFKLAQEDNGTDTTAFWETCAAKVGVNFPSRKARERVVELMEASHG